jgi:hypothetical protein
MNDNEGPSKKGPGSAASINNSGQKEKMPHLKKCGFKHQNKKQAAKGRFNHTQKHKDATKITKRARRHKNRQVEDGVVLTFKNRRANDSHTVKVPFTSVDNPHKVGVVHDALLQVWRQLLPVVVDERAHLDRYTREGHGNQASMNTTKKAEEKKTGKRN